MGLVGRIEIRIDADVATLTLRNPEKLNAITASMLADLDAALTQIEANRRLRAIVLRAAPSRAFSAGADVREWSALSPVDLGRRWIRDGNRIFSRLAGLEPVTISVIGAHAYGGGLELALGTDFRIAAAGVELGLPETGIAAVPGWLGVGRLAALVGLARARRMVLLGEAIDAATALTWGLVDQVAEAADLDAATDRLVTLVRSRSAVALGAAKRILSEIADVERLASMHEWAAALCRASPDGDEGVNAFKAKRKADFSRRGE